MANSEHLKLLSRGVDEWNLWREADTEPREARMWEPVELPDGQYYWDYPDLTNHIDLSGADLRDADLSHVNLSNVYLNNADLKGADVSEANLSGVFINNANLSGVNFMNSQMNNAHLNNTDLTETNLKNVNLSGAYLKNADLSEGDLYRANLFRSNLDNARLVGANLVEANFSQAVLTGADFTRADLTGALLKESYLTGSQFLVSNLHDADFTSAIISSAVFNDVNLSTVKGLSTVRHLGPSIISIDTLYKSGGEIPHNFLLGCGVPDEFVIYLPSLIGAQQAIQFYSCFISYSHHDEDFVRRLYSRMREANLRVWFAAEDTKGGEKLHEQIYKAIQVHDKLLLVLSEHSLESEWVMTEIRSARRTEIREKRRKLFPIRLVDMNVINKWQCFDADIGKDLAVEVREYFIPDFSHWRTLNAFEEMFDRLINDMRTDGMKG